MMLKENDKVRARQDLIESASDDHPALLYAKKNDILVIRKVKDEIHDRQREYLVSHEGVNDKAFYVLENEIDLYEKKF